MTFIIADRVKETSTSTGTGDITLAGAMTGFSAFSARCAVGDTLYYAIQAVDAGGTPTGEWECGLGTYSAANTLTRTTVTSSSSSDEAVSFEAGTKQVYITMPSVQAAAAVESVITLVVSDETTALTTGAGKMTVRTPFAMTLTAVRASVSAAPTGSLLTVDINEAGTSILSTKLTIDDSEKTSTTATAAVVISDPELSDDAEVSVDIDTVGSTFAGAGLKVYLIGRKLNAFGIRAAYAIFGYGTTGGTSAVSMTNLVSSAGVVATDTAGVGTARYDLAAAGYGTDKAIFGYGYYVADGIAVSMTNLVSNTGVVAADTTGVGTARYNLAAAGYGTDKAIFGYGTAGGTGSLSMTNLVSSAGVAATDTAGVGTARRQLAAAGYGTDKAIFGYGTVGTSAVSMTNLVSNTGVVAADTTGVGTARRQLAAAGCGTDKAIFGYGYGPTSAVSITNLVSNTGVVATDTAGVGTARYDLAAASIGA
jgi:hypothetical protein